MSKAKTNGDGANLKIDPEFESLIPAHAKEDRDGLEATLITDGKCHDTIKVWKGVIIDGHTRYKICIDKGIPFKVQAMKFADRDAAKLWSIRFHKRRHLTPFQKTQLALLEEPLIAAEAKRNQKRAKGKGVKGLMKSSNLNTRKEVAKLAGVSEQTVSRVKEIIEQAPEDVKAKVAAGEMSIAAAHKAATSPPEPAKPAVTLDTIGNPIPETRPDIIEAFTNAKEIHDPMLNHLTGFSKLLNRASGKSEGDKPMRGCERTSAEFQAIERDNKNARSGVKETRPYALCPYCRGLKSKCEGCKNLGWVPRQTWESAPADMREKAKAA